MNHLLFIKLYYQIQFVAPMFLSHHLNINWNAETIIELFLHRSEDLFSGLGECSGTASAGLYKGAEVGERVK